MLEHNGGTGWCTCRVNYLLWKLSRIWWLRLPEQLARGAEGVVEKAPQTPHRSSSLSSDCFLIEAERYLLCTIHDDFEQPDYYTDFQFTNYLCASPTCVFVKVPNPIIKTGLAQICTVYFCVVRHSDRAIKWNSERPCFLVMGFTGSMAALTWEAAWNDESVSFTIMVESDIFYANFRSK